jgi:ABC-2 type transport system permease protein
MNTLKALIRRELQEHKWGFVYLPWIVGAFMSLVVVMVYLGLTEVNTENFKFSTDVFADSEVVQSMKEATFEQRRAAIKAGLLVLGFPLVIALGFAILAYSLSTFFDERKDKSIIFWRSLPVSDSFTVFSKLIVALVVAPLLVIPALLFLHLVSVTAGSIYFAVSDIVSFTWAWQAYPWLDWIRVIFSLWMQSLWSLPIITWIMLAGAYSRKPVVAAILPPVVVVLVEGVSLSSSVFLDSLFERVQPWSRASSFPKEYESLGVAELSDIPLLFGMTEFWVGILVSSVFIYLTIYFRSKSDYASVE